MGRSKYEVMENAIQKQVQGIKDSVGDQIQEKRLLAKLKSIDEETDEKIKQIKSTPVNKDQLKKQAKAELERAKKENKRQKEAGLQQAENEISQAKLDIEKSKKRAEEMIKQAELDLKKRKDRLDRLKEETGEEEQRENMEAEQRYQNIMASIDDTEKTIQLKIDRAKREAKERKLDIEMELEGIKAKNKSKQDEQKYHERIYKDVKEIGIKQSQQ